MRVCDVIAEFIHDSGYRDVFMFPGGGNKFLIDGLAQRKDIRKISCHHEQGLAMAVVGYAKYKGMGFGMVTTGCGGTNTITGVLNAWQDSTACMFISGQCHSRQLISCVDVPIRQMGIQEADIVAMISPITKYAVTIRKPEDILYELEKAFFIAREGRPGPVWIDVPLDVSSTEVEKEYLGHFDAQTYKSRYIPHYILQDVQEVFEDLKQAKRPVIIAGQGIRLSGAMEEFKNTLSHFDVPAVFARMGFDTLTATNKYHMGVIGNHGNRMGNLTMQNADYILCLGSRLGINAVGYSYDLFAREAKVCVVDIDENEHKKGTVHIEKFIHADIKKFLNDLLQLDSLSHQEWLNWCGNVKTKCPTCPEEKYDDSKGISMYAFLDELSQSLSDDAIVCADAGSAFLVTPQALLLNSERQRYITSGGQAEMGFTVPACVGAAVASGKTVIGITGDGSFMLNMQELATIAYNKLPVKLFIWNNNGYMGIRQMQNNNFSARLLGVDEDSGLDFPDFQRLAESFDIKHTKITTLSQLRNELQVMWSYQGPILYEVTCQADEVLVGAGTRKLSNGENVQILEDMTPYLPRKLFDSLMLVSQVQ